MADLEFSFTTSLCMGLSWRRVFGGVPGLESEASGIVFAVG